MATHKYTIVSRGCFGDGAFGHQHVRERLSALLQAVSTNEALEASTRADADNLAEELLKPISDDASEENDAIDMLNDHAVDGVHFEFVDGDLILMGDSDE